jgi:hypothetical protein
MLANPLTLLQCAPTDKLKAATRAGKSVHRTAVLLDRAIVTKISIADSTLAMLRTPLVIPERVLAAERFITIRAGEIMDRRAVVFVASLRPEEAVAALAKAVFLCSLVLLESYIRRKAFPTVTGKHCGVVEGCR